MSGPLTYSTGISNYISNNPDKPSVDLINHTLGTSNITTYSNFYLPGKKPEIYADELIVGHSPAAMNQSILPGNRYFINTNKVGVDANGKLDLSKRQTCYDVSGKPHNLSRLVDNVQHTKIVTDSSNQGLLYSLYASLKDYDKGITNVDLTKNSHSCMPITAYLDDNGTKNKSNVNFVLNSDAEGFMDLVSYKKSPFPIEGSNADDSTLGASAVFGSAANEKSASRDAPKTVPTVAPTTSVINPITGKPMLAVPPSALIAGGDNINTLKSMANALGAMSNGSTTAATLNSGTAQVANDFANQFNSGSGNNFTTLAHETITPEKNPAEDPIFLFYILSLGFLVIYIGYSYYNKMKK